MSGFGLYNSTHGANSLKLSRIVEALIVWTSLINTNSAGELWLVALGVETIKSIHVGEASNLLPLDTFAARPPMQTESESSV